MYNSSIFERNLSALSQNNPELCARLESLRLSKAVTGLRHYTFLETANGELIPACMDSTGTAIPPGGSRALHSTIDPQREAKRLIDTIEGENILVFLGLGAAYYVKAALERKDISMALVFEYDINGLAELFSRLDYTSLFSDSRFRLFTDISEAEIKQLILGLYKPAIYGGIRVVPLRSRTAMDSKLFSGAADAITLAIEAVSADYSVQAHFGKRWFSNIVRNLMAAEEAEELPLSIHRAAVCAAGPSLSVQIGLLRERRKDLFLIASDTSLPCLLAADIRPDAIISIDCQHISYYHFMDGLPEGIPLFLDLASPPLLASLTKLRCFVSGGHPLTRYVSQTWKAMLELDTSGGNVSYAAVSLAEHLGAEEIELYGADFSYPQGISYARGAYIYPFFTRKANRLTPLEAHISAFLYRTPLEKKNSSDAWYYETRTLSFYREKLEEKSKSMEALLIPAKGMGAPINLPSSGGKSHSICKKQILPRNKGMASISAGEFLLRYRNDIARLPAPVNSISDYLNSLNDNEQTVFTTILPSAAALKKQNPKMSFPELFDITRKYCLKVLKNACR